MSDDDRGTELRDLDDVFEGATARIEHAERLADVSDLQEAADRLADAGGIAAVQTLAVDLERDATALADLARRAETLADRAEAVDIPIRTLRQLA